ncbi:hypothetical protein BaRGS_00003228 [Batillaria attramentaria]|uniref:Potassium channel domain-containing protein n=1 Tax=Batillaria attramentaria TaxID=370345 RepID=A0ABD0M269_9CAEN
MSWRVNLVLFSVLLVYLLVGALVFHVLEFEKSAPSDITSSEFFLEFLTNHPNVSTTDLTDFASRVASLAKDGAVVGNSSDVDNGWTYATAIFFCVTVITTVGYGNISPSTDGGKVLCLLYALVGIPLMATLLAGVGSTLHRPIAALHNARPWYRKDKFRDKLIKASVFVFTFTEDWDYVTAVYFSTITLTTVGFGDYVAGQKGQRNAALYRCLMSVWLVFGLAWVALCFSAVSSIFSGKDNEVDDSKSEEPNNEEIKRTVTGSAHF